jgi:hypothetical protein
MVFPAEQEAEPGVCDARFSWTERWSGFRKLESNWVDRQSAITSGSIPQHRLVFWFLESKVIR